MFIFIITQFMAVDVDTEYGGAGSNFFSAVILVEEISKIDMAPSVMIDIQNTLINSLFRKLGTTEQKKKYLPRLCTNTVSTVWFHCKTISFLPNPQIRHPQLPTPLSSNSDWCYVSVKVMLYALFYWTMS